MKVVHINTWDTGGAANAAKRIFRAQKKRDIDASFISLIAKATEEEDLHNYKNYLVQKYGKVITSGIILLNRFLNQIPTRFNKKIFFNQPKSLYRLAQHPLVKEADIIHLHGVAKFINFPTFFKQTKQPIVWTLHDMNPFSGGKHYESMMFDHLIPLEKKYLQIKKEALLNKNIHIVAPSMWLKEISQKSELFSKFPHSNIPYCIDINTFHPVAKKTTSAIKTILFIAENLNDPRKGFNYLIDALKYLDNTVKVQVLGKVESKEIFAGYPNIEHLGYISSSTELSKIYSNADIYVIPSIEDNLPNTIIESHLCGTPVVGFNTSGISNMIEHEFNGFLANNISGQALVEGIEKVFQLLDQEVITTNQIITKSRADYSEEKVIESYSRIYTQALGSN